MESRRCRLTAADYNGAGAGQNEAWTYDGAGNRSNTGYAYDKLNRMTASPGASYLNDTLGNRTWKNYAQQSAQRYVWDEMGRLSSLCGTSQGAKYTYRVDGLRTKKVEGLTIQWVDDGSQGSEEESSGHYDEFWATNKPTTRYYYDGQMSFEDDYTVIAGGFGTPQVTVTRYALGARGIDGIETTTTQGASVVYPIYDGHGNMTCTLSRSGLSFSRANDREYGAWGDIRSGSGGDQGYVANLGHRRDAESGLTYMRARYYEPGTGRFISEDPALDGLNWYAYCRNNPVNLVDYSGRQSVDASDAWEIAERWIRKLGWEDLLESRNVRIVSILVTYASLIGAAMGIAFLGDKMFAFGMSGGAAGVFRGNPTYSGVCGVAALVGLGLSLYGRLSVLMLLYDMAIELWLVSGEDGI